MPGTSPTPQVPQPGGEIRRVVVAGVQLSSALQHLVRQHRVEVVGPKPHTFTKFTEPVVLQCGPQGGAGAGVGADAGDHQRVPCAVPLAQPGVDRVVLTPLPGQQPVGQAIAILRPHQVPALTILVNATRTVGSLMSKSAVSLMSSLAVAHAGCAPRSTLSTTERAVIREAVGIP